MRRHKRERVSPSTTVVYALGAALDRRSSAAVYRPVTESGRGHDGRDRYETENNHH
jgi:hypothetical protein